MRIRELKVTYGQTVATMDSRRLKDPEVAKGIICRILDDEPSEVIGALMLTTRHTLIGWYEAGRGTLSSCQADVPGLVRAALMANAAAIILGHNHPSGDPSPSPDDLELTRRLQQACALFGIDVLDHIITGGPGQVSSFKERGQL